MTDGSLESAGMPLFTRLVGAVAAIAFAVTLTAHLLAFANIDIEPIIGYCALGIPVVGTLTLCAHYRDFRFKSPPDLLRPWAAALMVAAAVYCMGNFMLMSMTSKGKYQLRDGAFVVVTRGSVRAVSEAEWHVEQNREMRTMTTWPLAFYLSGTLLCWGRRRQPVVSGS